MSKMDNLRAMREARYEQAAARSPKAAAQQTATPTAPSTSTTKTATRVAPPTPPAPAPSPAPTGTAAEEALCGHRAISGRTCTREAGHAAKSHRYA
jgi:hypothetical protein